MNYIKLMNNRRISSKNIRFKPSTEKKLRILRESRERHNQDNTMKAPLNHLEWNRKHYVSSGTR